MNKYDGGRLFVWHNNLSCGLDDTQSGKMIRISKNGTLNIYIAVDISESIEEEDVEKAKKAIITLIRKVRNKHPST